ncbi:MAG: rRNA pseudouridine synthase [Candidatus Zixiibacteriota bacterium]|nr:MAG: rRNA pseudouridine synthase [candidate division Zixibacteria bacterium]
MIRINKYLSLSGISSRRGAEQLIREGKVTVNDVTIDRVGTIINEENDVVKVDGTVATPVSRKYYILLNKPQQVLTTLFDPFRRKTVAYYTKSVPVRVYPVGRLDYDTEGALILTNDGDLAYRLAHPKYGIRKIYNAVVNGIFRQEDADRITRGVKLEDGYVGRAESRLISVRGNVSKIELILTEGRKREVKQLLKSVGYPVIYLRRVSFAGLRVDKLKVGRWRYINHQEIRHLKDLVGL